MCISSFKTNCTGFKSNNLSLLESIIGLIFSFKILSEGLNIEPFTYKSVFIDTGLILSAVVWTFKPEGNLLYIQRTWFPIPSTNCFSL